MSMMEIKGSDGLMYEWCWVNICLGLIKLNIHWSIGLGWDNGVMVWNNGFHAKDVYSVGMLYRLEKRSKKMDLKGWIKWYVRRIWMMFTCDEDP